jgi:energy-coupling factor transporter ATP-binding protein EcfA2
MLNLFCASGSLFHTAVGIAYADLTIDGHRETWAIRSRQFRTWLRRCYFEETGCAANSAVLSSALDLLEAKAQFDAPERTVDLRVAEHQGSIYLDLADQAWQSIRVTPEGWERVNAPTVRFRRTPGMLSIAEPQRSGSIEKLLPFLNLASRNDFVLVVAWLLAALRAQGPYPLLAIVGEQGSAKTTLARILRGLLDPNVAPVRALSRDERELMITANNGHVLAFDNLSGLPPTLSDSFCRLASGGSFAVRRLYTNDEEVIFQAARPIILNGIEDLISRPDLADRAVFLTLPCVADKDRRPEREFWREFELARPGIVGALLDAVSYGLRAVPSVRLSSLPRMADFAVWVCACEGALWPRGTFMRAFGENRRSAVQEIIDGDPLARCVRQMLAGRVSWTGTASDLLCAAEAFTRHDPPWSTSWPRTPRALAGRLRRCQAFLRTIGVQIAFSREGHAGNRTITIWSTAENQEAA